jgi:hypothetical protein
VVAAGGLVTELPDYRPGFAFAIADPRYEAKLIAADNSLAGTATLPDALASGGTVAVRPRAEVLALDLDDPAYLSTLDEISDCLLATGITPVVVASGGQGRRHLFAEVPDPVLRERLKEQAREAGIDARANTHIRPPLMPHRAGHPVELISPADPREALAALGGSRAAEEYRFARGGQLPPRYASLLAQGDVQGEFPSRSEMQWAITLSAAQHGWSEAKLWAELMSPYNVGGERTREIVVRDGERSAARQYAGQYDKACKWIEAHPPVTSADDAIGRLHRFSGLADTHSWPGKTGSSERAVLAALIGLGLACYQVEVQASLRQLADLSNLDKKAVAGALRRLDGSWIKRLSIGRYDQASTFKLLLNANGTGPIRISTTGGVSSIGPFALPNHDVFTTGALGLTGWRVINALHAPSPVTARQIADSTGLSPQTVRESLRQGAKLGLAQQYDRFRWVTGAATLTDAGADCVAAERRFWRRIRHRHEQDGYRRRFPVVPVADAESRNMAS